MIPRPRMPMRTPVSRVAPRVVKGRVTQRIPSWHPIIAAIPGDALNSSQYPAYFDDFIPINERGDYHVGQDYFTLFDCIGNIQDELGINPAGDAGSIASRLMEAKGNISSDGTDGGTGWTKLEWGWTQIQANKFLEDKADAVITTSVDFGDQDLGWGAGLPVIFMQAGESGAGPTWHPSGAWRVTEVDVPERANGTHKFVARTRAAIPIGVGDTTLVQYSWLAINWTF